MGERSLPCEFARVSSDLNNVWHLILLVDSLAHRSDCTDKRGPRGGVFDGFRDASWSDRVMGSIPDLTMNAIIVGIDTYHNNKYLSTRGVVRDIGVRDADPFPPHSSISK